MKTFNNKSPLLNAIAIPFSLVGFALLIVNWAYMVVFQWVFLPKHKWVDVLSKDGWKLHSHYPNWFCYWLCTCEENMINHLRLMRDALDEDYCDETI